MSTLIVLNAHAWGGKAPHAFEIARSRIGDLLGDHTLIVTQRKEEVASLLNQPGSEDYTTIIAVGGDGTNHWVMNAILEHQDRKIAFGSIPLGTGRDWPRSLGTPSDPLDALIWLAGAEEIACDVGLVEYRRKDQQDFQKRKFINVASAGISGEVDARVNRTRIRTPLTFIWATVMTLIGFKPRTLRILCDRELFYEGPTTLLAVANGRAFGRGMKIAPHALINDGLLDIVMVEGVSRLKAVLRLNTIFSGKHLLQREVRHTRAKEVNVLCTEGEVSVDMDGEEAKGEEMRFSILPNALPILMRPHLAAILRTD